MFKKFFKEKRGFTLVEIMIVVTILGVLAVVVVVSVMGLLNKGQKEGYLTDEGTIYKIVAAFYTEQHSYSDAGGWNEADDILSIHNYPIGNPTDEAALDLYLGAVVPLGKYRVNTVMDPTENEAADDADIMAAVIWMGLLTNGPGYGDALCADPNPDHRDYVSPLNGETGPYLSPLPDSCSTYNYSKGRGTYTWIMGEYGRVYGVFKDGVTWYAGFNGRYP